MQKKVNKVLGGWRGWWRLFCGDWSRIFGKSTF